MQFIVVVVVAHALALAHPLMVKITENLVKQMDYHILGKPKALEQPASALHVITNLMFRWYYAVVSVVFEANAFDIITVLDYSFPAWDE